MDAFGSEEDVPPAYWRVIVQDAIYDPQAGGFHLDENGQPYAEVRWSPDWSLAASHECLEMLADPFGSQVAGGQSLKPGQGRVSYLVEICDPCEDRQFAYTINTGSGANEVVVSDFYTPNYFDPVGRGGVLYSFRGSLTRPLQVRNNGYISWRNPADGHIWQLFGPVEMENFRDGGKGRLNREYSDALVRTHRARMGALLRANRADGCELTRDPITGTLSGKKGDHVTLKINGTAGNAHLLAAVYGGESVDVGDGSGMTVTLKDGPNILHSVIDAIPGDIVELRESPCNALVDSVKFDNSNPFLDDLEIDGN